MQNMDIDESDPSNCLVRRESAGEGSGTRHPAAASQQRGLRAARIADILAEIENGFSDPGFSTRAVAVRLGLSVRYVQDLMKVSGVNITERIQELRLQKAHAILIHDHSCMQRISEVAAACGFNEVSHFHRCFRRRFGATPARFRARMQAAT
jgi:AraC-like DNA-binding protein